jgi:hypothetical protein
LIWIAGTERIVFKNDSRVGFHAAYNPSDGQEHGATNALIGAYLTRLGFNYSAVVYLTSAAPDEMEWLDDGTAKKYGIKVTVYNNPNKNDAARLDKQTDAFR